VNRLVPAILYAQKKPYLLILVIAILVNLAGISVKYFTDDPALYSVLARNMAQSFNFTDLMYRGNDWLDKPHFPFWMTAISFKIFGINTIAYKLPALLFFFLSAIYTYKLAKKFYDVETGLIAVLVLLTAQHVIMSNTDVRAEPYIMGLLMGAVYHFCKVKDRFTWADILLASLFTACAVMTKGIYLLTPIGSGIICDYLFRKDIKGLFQWKWLLSIVLVAVFVLPEIYTLYMQFDTHPEKIVFGKAGISGIHWFLWDSQFGRFNNNSFIRNTHGSVFFFVHTLLWAFAPWALLFYFAIFRVIRKIIKKAVLPEYVTISGALIMLLVFSVSKFQLPFYTNILFPFFAIITAVFIKEIIGSNKNLFFSISQYTINVLLIAVIVVLNFIFAPGHWPVFLMLSVALALITWYIYNYSETKIRALFLFTCCVSVFVNSYLIIVVYPTLVAFKGDVQAAAYINQYHPKEEIISAFNVPNAFEFYTRQPVVFMDMADAAKHSNALILINEGQKAELQKNNTPFQLIQSFDNYPNENITLPFIIESKRLTALNHFFLVKMSGIVK
jgi:4-amino-4-deoxy-L-arabinose transferase-like glycosyltransferase